MRSHNASTLIVLAAVLSAACAPQTPGPISESDVAGVRATLDAYAKAALAGDWDAWGKTLTTDVVYMPPNLAPIMGREAAVNFGRAFPKLNTLTLTASEVTGLGDLAYARGTFAYTLTLPDGTAAADSGSFLDVYRRQADGAWLHSHAIWHSDIPLPVVAPTVR